MHDDLGMRNDVSNCENNPHEFDEGPIQKNVGWLKSKLKRFKIGNSVQNTLPSTISVTQQDSSDIIFVRKFESVGQEKRSIIKNLFVICLAFLMLSTAFQSMLALHSNFGILRTTFGVSAVSNICHEKYQFGIHKCIKDHCKIS